MTLQGSSGGFPCRQTEKVAAHHAIVVTVDHDGTSASQVNVFLPPVAHLESKQNMALH